MNKALYSLATSTKPTKQSLQAMSSSSYRSLASRVSTPVPAPKNSAESRATDLNVNVIKGKNQQNHVLFLHGLFGKGQSFQFLAKAKAI